MKLIESVITEKIDTEENNKKEIEIDWEELENINQDIIGWIKIEGTNINYPILKDDANLKYINRSYDGKYNSNGSIFTINENAFEDNETILYGHNMKTGLMFSNLDKYMNREFLNEHSIIEIYTKNQNYKAKIFSCYSIGVKQEENNIKYLGFEDEIEYYKKASKYEIKNVEKIKKILKLSTCSYQNNSTVPTNQRYFIVAKLEKI